MLITGFFLPGLHTFQTLISALAKFFWDKTSDASFIRCDMFNMQPYLMGGRPYGCLYHNLYNDDYTELGVITFAKTITLDRYHRVSSEIGEGNNRMIKTDSYFSSRLIDHFFLWQFLWAKIIGTVVISKQLNEKLHQALFDAGICASVRCWGAMNLMILLCRWHTVYIATILLTNKSTDCSDSRQTDITIRLGLWA